MTSLLYDKIKIGTKKQIKTLGHMSNLTYYIYNKSRQDNYEKYLEVVNYKWERVHKFKYLGIEINDTNHKHKKLK